MLTSVLFYIAAARAGVGLMDNFDDSDAKGWEAVEGDWKVKNKAYVETKQTEYAKTMAGDESWTDYTVECDITLVGQVQGGGSHDCAGLLVRADAKGENGYRFWIRTDPSRAQLSKWINNGFEHIQDNIAAGVIAPDTTHHLKVTVEGNRITCFIDGKQVADVKDDSEHRINGRIGLITYVANEPTFDNIMVSGEGMSMAVSAKGRLATNWGKIKRMH